MIYQHGGSKTIAGMYSCKYGKEEATNRQNCCMLLTT